ncbi:TetR/AcrR family transcriptional regulator [Williamsia deligens]|nr:TetR/AcrR family transcriptional regulator [Williamsia deligens]MCP2194165.1 transcriptional regulator, TetR family [Williamsia deligens]
MVTKRTPAAEVRDALIAAAHRVLAAQGVRGLTVRAVAAEAGVAPMGVYNHLDGKDGLMAVLVEDGFERLRQATVASADSDPVTRLRTAGRNYRAFALSNPTLYRLMFSGQCDVGEAGIAALGALTELIRYGQASGIVRLDDPQELTMVVWSCVHGAVSLELDAAAPGSVAVDSEHVFESVLSMIERGSVPD